MLQGIKKLYKNKISKVSYGGGETRKSKILLRKVFWKHHWLLIGSWMTTLKITKKDSIEMDL